MHHVETYPFIEYRYADGEIRYRTELPVRLLNPHTCTYVDTFALLDTGADACLFDRATTEKAGHELVGDGVVGSVTGGVGGAAKTYKHTIDLQLFNGDTDRIVWASGPRLFDCIDADIPPLLGHCSLVEGRGDFSAATKRRDISYLRLSPLPANEIIGPSLIFQSEGQQKKAAGMHERFDRNGPLRLLLWHDSIT